MSKRRQLKPVVFIPVDAASRGRSRVYDRATGIGRDLATASGKSKRNAAAPRKPRIAMPRYDLNEVEVQGVLGALGGEGGTAAAGAPQTGGGDLSFLFKKVGGLDGIISTMSKVQRMYTLFQQMGPIFKLMGGFGGFGGLGGLLGGAQAKTASVKPGSSRRPARRKSRKR
ncbi:hypothetical protein PAESOLCIP111_02011 [Paenibacillus solanacearum]|uniref:Uncharacterized protein n=1 Tax=Paenibacillus solanacearum TaxID=2048548 RepID=A0A916NHZ1_9BACL|nr:hypothetical protein [Paenibacillus solanacearum]CAG7617323.1 hypothetical protein PAESOLCIP111_02011 [Paenibacillus solanacearum]